MASVLAIVSKAVFEKAMKTATVGDVYETDRYITNGKAFETLAGGDAIFLVTVRPGEQLWLVGVLERPRYRGGAWVAATNTVPIADITPAIGGLAFESGQGLHAKPGALAMSLQTPRVLAEADVKLLRGLVAPAATAYASVVAATPKAQEADRYAAAAAEKTRRFRFENCRMPLAPNAKHSKLEEQQIVRCLDEDGDATLAEVRENEDLPMMQVVDVVELATGTIVYDFYLWPFGSGILYEHGTTNRVADVIQHGFDLRAPDLAVREAIAAAYHEGATRLGLREHVDFTPGEKDRQPAKPPPATGTAIDDGITTLRAAIARGASPSYQELWNAVQPAFGKAYRPVPVRRLWELSPTERDALELYADAGRPCALPQLGLPLGMSHFEGDPTMMLRYLGRAPAGPLEATIEVDGRPHPVWCLVHDAVYEVRPSDAVIALLGALPADRLAAIWTALAHTREYRIRERIAVTKQEERESEIPAKNIPRVQAHRRRLVDLLVALNARLGPRGGELAVALAEEHRAMIDDFEKARFEDVFEARVALACLAARGAIEPRWDALFRASVVSNDEDAYRPLLFELLDALPRERAEAIAAAVPCYPEYVARYPSVTGVRALVGYIEDPKTLGFDERLMGRVFVRALGELARPLLEESAARHHGRVALVKGWLAELKPAKAKRAKAK